MADCPLSHNANDRNGSAAVVQTKEIASRAYPAMRSRARRSGAEAEGYCPESRVAIRFPGYRPLIPWAVPEVSPGIGDESIGPRVAQARPRKNWCD